MKRMVDPLVQISINSEFDSRIDALEGAPTGTKLYKHTLSGTTSTMDVVSLAVDYNPDPITSANFPTRMENALLIKSSSRAPFIAGYASQNGETSCAMIWVDGTTLRNLTITYTNVSDTITEL